MLKELTRQYIKVFSEKDLNGVSLLLDDDFVLEDPIVKRVEGKSKSLEVVKNIFNSCDKLSFSAKNIYMEGDVAIIEFVLVLDKQRLEGVDIIKWDKEKMKELRAYLDIPKD
ncbi:nuclear transport factor 2 family protein [Campylobacter lari]|uniref:nuclear transport factor 2 family protein n=1 Tax=Campylobacter lari TaxID=201 RepID=UPI0011A72984|nr:nuclear transport factor 2 family protein [Campylobacter lari]MBT0819858.1 nuclear transport factor 2 family protein [Campylobacter lari]MCV3458950.1 nuclear transport factor 2 family protein [Campylobacter lari]